MGLRISTNVTSLNAIRQLAMTRTNLDKALERLSSGSRINHSGDDAAGLAISENLRAQIKSLRQARRNAQDGISLIQVSEGGLTEIGNMLIRLRELAIQAASDTNGPVERSFSDREYQLLKQEIDRIANSTNFNGTALLNGHAGIFEIQVGSHNDAIIDRVIYDASISDATLQNLSLSSEGVSTKEGAQHSIGMVDNALIKINGIRADLGAIQNRLMSTINNISMTEESISSANSRIKDADIAEESSELTKQNILMQAGVSVLSQANSANHNALKLLS